MGKANLIQFTFIFLGKFIEEMKTLSTEGLVFDNKKNCVLIDFFICDAPARSYLKGTLGHNSVHAYDRCCIRVNLRTT